MDNSNHTLRWCRTSREAIGYRLQSWHFSALSPDTGDKVVAIGCIVVSVLLMIGGYVFDWKIGG